MPLRWLMAFCSKMRRTTLRSGRLPCSASEPPLFQHALEHYTDFGDIERVMLNSHVNNLECLAAYFFEPDAG